MNYDQESSYGSPIILSYRVSTFIHIKGDGIEWICEIMVAIAVHAF